MAKRKYLLRGGAFARIPAGHRQELAHYYTTMTEIAYLWVARALDLYFIPSDVEIAQNLEIHRPGRSQVDRIVRILNASPGNLLSRAREIRGLLNDYLWENASVGYGKRKYRR